MRTNSLTLCLVAAGLAVAGCGDDGASVECGAGTTLQDGACVADPGTTCGAGTTMQNGECVATTTTCGPGTLLQGDECVLDVTAPGPVTDFAATASGSDIDLTWTAGANSAGTVVARVSNGTYDAPARGVTYTVGMTLPGGSPVIAVGSGTTATDAVTTPGRYSYYAFSQNASGNYGFGREAAAITLPAQTATLTIDVAASTVTVSTQPANLALAAADFSYDSGTGSLSFTLTATNNTAGHLFNLKAVVTGITGGTTPSVDAPTGTTADGDPFVTLGFAALLPADETGRTVTLAGVGATDTLTLDITLIESGLALLGPNIVDLAGGPSVVPEFPTLRTAPNPNAVVFRGGWFSPSARYLYALTRYDMTVSRIDTTSGDVTSIATVGAWKGYGACTTVDHEGFLYAVHASGQHFYSRNDTPMTLEVAKIDPGSFAIIGTARVVFQDNVQTHSCTTAGTKLYIAHAAGAYVVDTATMQFVDADDSTPDVIDPIAIGDANLFDVVSTDDGATVYASSRDGGDIYSIDTATDTATLYHTATTGRVTSPVLAAGTLWFGGAGWEGGATGLFSFDGATETSVANFADEVTAIGYVRDGKAFVATTTGTKIVDLTTGESSSIGDLTSGWVPGHVLAVAPTP
jgi:hypothetical protein